MCYDEMLYLSVSKFLWPPLYKGYCGIVSGDSKCPDPASSTAKVLLPGRTSISLLLAPSCSCFLLSAALLVPTVHLAASVTLPFANATFRRSLHHTTALISNF